MGRIIYAKGGVHAVRRWRRNVMQYCPQIAAIGFKVIAIQQDIAVALGNNHPISWDYVSTGINSLWKRDLLI
ncbi:hypothetical protein VB715_09120 [Crocosphaera sp. UHCC 0190]|uniref:hypothetical protein n=1 Tax=Crocosphaera sp. UHCC 0190 TaxID=3110246 RepID=UPI002B20425B|nr:hypothetical protein [Crocosphaera sp. UHCC 0190]MEA5509924.1 hypothetical protein [Crocosphaera sp. UHCC 0190]